MEQSAARKAGKGGQIVCLAPDVCNTPSPTGPVPVPYMIVSMLDWAQRTVASTKLGDQEAFTMNSRTNKVTGDEPGTVGGVVSGCNMGWCRPISSKSNVFVENFQVIQNDCLFEMNCSGPEGPGNTVGRLLYFDTP
ncbi:MAG: DUF4150 domain-containing protein [Rubellimicrobium sp.]|nr:DUF4150 domain-containing protein [Rubellimicrobium sp.]